MTQMAKPKNIATDEIILNVNARFTGGSTFKKIQRKKKDSMQVRYFHNIVFLWHEGKLSSK